MRTSRRLLAVPAAVALLVALTACAGASPEPGADVKDTPAATAPAEQAVELTTANFVDTLVSAQKKAGSYDFTMTTTAAGQTMTATGSMHAEGETPAIAMVMSTPEMGSDLEIRFVDGIMYMNLGELTANKFLQIDPTDATNPLAAGMGDMTGSLDPTKSMRAQEAAIMAVTKTGEPEEVDGVMAQPYEVVMDTTKLAKEQRAQFDAAAAAGLEIPSELRYRYWFDAENLMRKMVVDVMGSQTEMIFRNWGSGAAVEAPTADQITTDSPF